MSNTSSARDNAHLELERIPSAAQRMALSVRQVYREINAGRLGPLVKIGKSASALPASAVDRWIAQRIEEARTSSGT